MGKPFSKYNNLKVSELKVLLKERGLPISGTKKILIEQLENNDKKSFNKTLKEEIKVQFNCNNCSSRLKVPKSYHGKIMCPNCSKEQEVLGSELKRDFSINMISDKIKNLDQKQISLAISIIAGILILISILTFFSAFTYEAMCPEEGRTTVIIDGEEFPACNAGWGPEFISKIFNACCILLPISLILAIIGYGVRKEADVKIYDITKTSQNRNEFTVITKVENESTIVDKTTKVIQISILGFSIGLTIMALIATVVIIVFIFLAIYALLNSQWW